MRDYSRFAAFAVLVLLLFVLAIKGPSIGFFSAPVLRLLAVIAIVAFLVRRSGGGCCAPRTPVEADGDS